jgi:hypothetical protein
MQCEPDDRCHEVINQDDREGGEGIPIDKFKNNKNAGGRKDTEKKVQH